MVTSILKDGQNSHWDQDLTGISHHSLNYFSYYCQRWFLLKKLVEKYLQVWVFDRFSCCLILKPSSSFYAMQWNLTFIQLRDFDRIADIRWASKQSVTQNVFDTLLLEYLVKQLYVLNLIILQLILREILFTTYFFCTYLYFYAMWQNWWFSFEHCHCICRLYLFLAVFICTVLLIFMILWAHRDLKLSFIPVWSVKFRSWIC